MMKEVKINFNKLVGSGYIDVINDYKHRNISLAGARASGKSTFAAYRALKDLLVNPNANILYIRQVYKDHKDSTYKNFKKILIDPEYPLSKTGLSDFFEFKQSPLEIRFWRNGKGKGEPQLIVFKGLDDGNKIQSIAVAKGYIKTVIIEEAHQIQDDTEIEKLNLSIRGHEDQQFIFCLNMYSKYCHCYQKFYKETPKNTVALIKNYEHNEFLTRENNPAFFEEIDNLKHTKPKQYEIVCGLRWGSEEFTVYDEEDYEIVNNLAIPDGCERICGLDLGFTQDPTALVELNVNRENKAVYINKLVYKTGMLNTDIAKYLDCKTIADCASPKDIADLNRLRPNIEVLPCRKGKDSIAHGIRIVKEYKLYIDSRLDPLIEELQKYVYDENTHKPVDRWNHALDAIRYVIMYINAPKNSIKTYNLKDIKKKRRRDF